MKDYEEEVFKKAVKLLEEAGAVVVENTDVAGAELFHNAPQGVKDMTMQADFRKSIKDYLDGLATNPNGIHCLTDLIEFTKNHKEEESPKRNVEQWEIAEKAGPGYKGCEEFEKMVPYLCKKGGIHAAIEKHGVELFIAPTAADPASIALGNS